MYRTYPRARGKVFLLPRRTVAGEMEKYTMMSGRRPLFALLLSAVLVSGVAVGVSAPAHAESAAVIYGSVKDSSTGYSVKSFKVTLFDADFTYLKETRVNKNGRYQISSPGPGIYHLQFVDARPPYDTKAYAARLDVPVRVVSTSWVQKSVKVHRGGAIGGSVRVRGKRVPNATIRAISDHGQVITVQSDKKGQYGSHLVCFARLQDVADS